MNITKVNKAIVGKRALIEGKWEFLEFDSVGIVTEIKTIDELIIIYLDNQSKFVGEVNKIVFEEKETIDFIKSTPENNEIIIFRVKLL